jgi:CheY-like chemotaxis protein
VNQPDRHPMKILPIFRQTRRDRAEVMRVETDGRPPILICCAEADPTFGRMFSMKILALSTDPELVLLRKRILEISGHEVTGLSTEKEAMLAAEEDGRFDVVVLCHRLSDATARKLIRLFRERQPETKLVYVVHIYGEWPEVEADRYVVGADGPDALVRVVSEAVAPAAS